MTLAERLAPFYGRRCDLDMPEAAEHFGAAPVRLYVFDWRRVPEALQDILMEKSGGHDDFVPFAVVDYDRDAGSLEDMVEGPSKGFLVYAEDTPDSIYLAHGELDIVTHDDANGFFARLVPARGGEAA